MTAPQTSFTERVDALAPARRRLSPSRDIVIWLSVAVATLTLASVAVETSEVVGPTTLPWWPAQNLSLHVTAGMVVAPLTAAGVLAVASRPAAARMSWNTLLVLSYLASITWSAALHTNVAPTTMSTATAGARGATALLVSYTGSEAGLAITVVAVSCLTVPLTLVAVKSVSGPVAARALAPVLILGPWAAWSTLGIDGVAAAACAAVLACGAVVSERRVKGSDAFWGAAATGGLLGAAALLSYGAAWFAVSLLCLYFARRRPTLILVSAWAALAVLAVAAAFGNSWPHGLVDTYDAAIGEIAAHPGQLWWLALMPALVFVACGPAAVESLRRFGSSSAWPLMIGPLLALMIAPLSGSNPERPEYGWIALCPWLIVAVTARGDRKRSVRAPLAATAAGACAAIVLMYSG
ncbi:hypothetical protein K3N28_14460 [Glycomyces sp. TRM65418]|uniref:hypothetical protein n=1 Tax=Glycomyces sp. TRM65418 TaxID=2867006 RepID=UPI001CE519EC|nr:hypothetical protein [Glycomyces sp. TRM65418]MCC3764264.1 hypothetical protein [Glycomyces sp. TRM65418]QZD53948.1 hypothetical protein K3N28_14385 [Glycomyces sp. TRM65418]